MTREDEQKKAHESSSGYLDPLATFKAASSSQTSLTSMCFLMRRESVVADNVNRLQKTEEREEEIESNDDSSSSGDEFEAHFGSKRKANDSSAAVGFIRNQLALGGIHIVTCDFDGNALIWDVGSSKVVDKLVESPRGPGLALRRVHDNCSTSVTTPIMYHSRDPCGIVSLHDTTKMVTVASISTFSHTFCAAAPCYGDENLVALPADSDSEVVVRDWRISPSSSPVARFPAAGTNSRTTGMLTSLAMWSSGGTNLLVCGMENGSLFFHDWNQGGENISSCSGMSGSALSSITLGTDPVLGLDASPSPTKESGNIESCICLAGLAGDAAELSELSEKERGRIALVKAKRKNLLETDQNRSVYSWQARLRTRLGTAAGKPGVAVCRFRPDGRIFAAGGWDKRVRLFRRDGTRLAILRGHEKSLQVIDWSPDAPSSGLMASGSTDGKICVWRCYGAAD